MATCRIYLFTYNRNDLLVRSVESLLKQTFTDWVCELHNDLPGNTFPNEYLKTLDDGRFVLMDHEVNFGPLKSFNLAFNECKERYISILEDDNWWEPEFLEVMTEAMNRHNHIQVGWANMKFWKEEAGNNWTDINRTVWPVTNGSEKFFHCPDHKKSYHAVHSNGAMLIRNQNIGASKTPLKMRFDFVEQVRERSFPHPLLLIERPLANFSITLQTNRAQNNEGIHEHYLLLLASYYKFFPLEDCDVKNIWNDTRESRVKTSNKLLYAGLIDRNCRALLAKATLFDWGYFLAYNFKYPRTFYRCLNAKKNYHELWDFLVSNTQMRFNESCFDKTI